MLMAVGRWALGGSRWSFVLGSAIVMMLAAPPRARDIAPLCDTGTFSILGYDPQTGEVGGAVQSRVFSVGNGVLWADGA
jgi:hypothetical protein